MECHCWAQCSFDEDDPRAATEYAGRLIQALRARTIPSEYLIEDRARYKADQSSAGYRAATSRPTPSLATTVSRELSKLPAAYL